MLWILSSPFQLLGHHFVLPALPYALLNPQSIKMNISRLLHPVRASGEFFFPAEIKALFSMDCVLGIASLSLRMDLYC